MFDLCQTLLFRLRNLLGSKTALVTTVYCSLSQKEGKIKHIGNIGMAINVLFICLIFPYNATNIVHVFTLILAMRKTSLISIGRL